MMRFLIVISVLVVPALGAAQGFPSEVQPGARVRVWLPEPVRQGQAPERRQLLRGTVESVDRGVMHLSVPGTMGSLTIPRSAVRRLDISRGISRPASVVERAVGGAISGAVLYAVLNDPKRTGGPHYRTDWRAAGVGAAWGGGAGAVIGFIWPFERWQRLIRGR
jgi:hypothetical protein